MRLRDRALILPVDCSVSDAYYLGYEKAIAEVLEDLKHIKRDTPQGCSIVAVIHFIKKWEAKKK